MVFSKRSLTHSETFQRTREHRLLEIRHASRNNFLISPNKEGEAFTCPHRVDITLLLALLDIFSVVIQIKDTQRVLACASLKRHSVIP